MVRRLLELPGIPAPDAADALACAICHAHAGSGFGAPRPRRISRARRADAHGRAERMATSTNRRPRAVMFDMDGLMLDTEPLSARAWTDAAAAHRRRLRPRARSADDRAATSRIARAMLRAHYPDPYPVDAVLADVAWRLRRDLRARGRRAQVGRARPPRLARGAGPPAGRGDVDAPRCARRRSSSRPDCCAASTRWSAATRCAMASRRPTSTSRRPRRLGIPAAHCVGARRFRARRARSARRRHDRVHGARSGRADARACRRRTARRALARGRASALGRAAAVRSSSASVPRPSRCPRGGAPGRRAPLSYNRRP